MENILEELWRGNLIPQERDTENGKALRELLKLKDRNHDRLRETMSAEQRETLEKYDDCIDEIHDIIEFEIFSYAFRLGGRFMLATLLDTGAEE